MRPAGHRGRSEAGSGHDHRGHHGTGHRRRGPDHRAAHDRSGHHTAGHHHPLSGPDDHEAGQAAGGAGRDEGRLEQLPGARTAGQAGPAAPVLAEPDRLLRHGDAARGERLPGAPRADLHRQRQPGHLVQAAVADPPAHPQGAVPADPGQAGRQAGRALHDRPRAVHQQDHPHAVVGGGRQGPGHHGRPLRLAVHADPRGPLPRELQEPRPRLDDLPHGYAVRDVLQRRPGGALLLGLRRPRLRRGVARLRQRTGQGRDLEAVRRGPGRRQGRRLLVNRPPAGRPADPTQEERGRAGGNAPGRAP
ncbi:hypothetical protein SBRY_10397 [Actinacidiphila bryophytorum]|uniref:Uncharacterized protein n=1 Tax=Actinacidiphila bryophytorum TaxID=1436133 RepID=A0A9W4GXE5_9ACTN|nr:hypothetical protein SBRY_10397 [Actinacidiphila bryophytorum]